MPTTDEVKAGGSRPIGRPEGIVDRLAQEGKARTRRRLIVRTGLWLALTAVAGFFIVVWQRNTRSIDKVLGQLEKPASAIEKSVRQYGWLPFLPPQADEIKLQYYCRDEAERAYAMNAGRPTIIGFTSELHMVLRGRGRGLLIYDNGQVHRKWASQPEFRRDWRQQLEARERFDEARRSRPPELPE